MRPGTDDPQDPMAGMFSMGAAMMVRMMPT